MQALFLIKEVNAVADCIFCKIVSKQIPSEVVYEDDQVFVFHDINPQAPTHLLVIPKEHIQSAAHVTEKDKELLGQMFVVIKNVTEKLGLDKEGYRIVNNCGELGGQQVDHLHFHVLGGRQMQWPPG